ncbi:MULTISPECIES: GNAT family N-acetyltransferase [Corynebacterium]|uniref:GNAT family N-acetyltransferase n=1 Tax=Corynebacterium TaxID=1716 RepID=UPI0004F5D1CB|nr:hypothetical protein [Corynebacterium amycolatum]AIN82419.1 acetyltransferase domain protein [Corynebacterium sp. ATCC 6931]
MIIRQATREDAEAIAEIYNEAVINTVAIWNDGTVSAENRIAWMEVHWEKGYPVFVATLDDEVAGYATFSDFRDFDGFSVHSGKLHLRTSELSGPGHWRDASTGDH